MNPSHVRQLQVPQVRSDRFVGRQHELFDHLMAFGVVDGMSTSDFAVFVQIDFDFWQNQVDATGVHPAFPHRHRQRVHVADEAETLVPKVSSSTACRFQGTRRYPRK